MCVSQLLRDCNCRMNSSVDFRNSQTAGDPYVSIDLCTFPAFLMVPEQQASAPPGSLLGAAQGRAGEAQAGRAGGTSAQGREQHESAPPGSVLQPVPPQRPHALTQQLGCARIPEEVTVVTRVSLQAAVGVTRGTQAATAASLPFLHSGSEEGVGVGVAPAPVTVVSSQR